MTDFDIDPQDQAEVFDEDTLNDPGQGPGPDMVTFEELPDVYDVTQALGDADVDDVLVARDADELEDADLEELGDDVAYGRDDEAEDDTLDDDLEDEPEGAVSFDDEEEDLDEVDGVDEPEDDEADLEYVEDVDETVSGAGRTATRFESRGELSNEDLEELGYQDGEEKK